jgi:MFS family permease
MLTLLAALIMMAFCRNVQTFAAAQVFYWTGQNGMLYVLDIFIADTTKLKNRLIWLTITTTPFICNAFAGPEVAQAFLHHSSWRWGYGTFAIITPFVAVPFWAVFLFCHRKAQKLGIVRTRKSGRSMAQSVVHWWFEFDGRT